MDYEITYDSQETTRLKSIIVSLLHLLRPYVPARTDDKRAPFPYMHGRRNPTEGAHYALDRFLDGLAAICADRPTCDVYAIAIAKEPHLETDTISLYFSSNHEVEQDLPDYVARNCGLIDNLRSISLALATTESDIEHYGNLKHNLQSLERELAVTIYKKCLPKVGARVQKHNRAYHLAAKLLKRHRRLVESAVDLDATGPPQEATALFYLVDDLVRFVTLTGHGTSRNDPTVKESSQDEGSSLSPTPGEDEATPMDLDVDEDPLSADSDKLYNLYQAGLAISSELKKDRLVKNFLEHEYLQSDRDCVDVTVGGYRASALHILEKVCKLSLASGKRHGLVQ
ncbi:hypothetical protein BD309DRAFT_984074, partial [Dichomitus squalens]